jgi:osmoprotectant transport system permease protein
VNLGSVLPLAVEIRNRKGEGGCVANDGFCPNWIVDNYDRYVSPFWEHVFLTVTSVAAGFIIAFVLALIAHRRKWLVGPITGLTGALYTIPSVAFFFLLQPLTGLGKLTAIVALTCYTLLIIFRNVITGLNAVPDETKDAARGMGLTENQLLWRVELPLAMPEILAGLRIATTTTVGLAALAFLAGAGGLGAELDQQRYFKSNVVVAGGLCVALAAALDIIILTVQRFTTSWQRAGT